MIWEQGIACILVCILRLIQFMIYGGQKQKQQSSALPDKSP